MGRSVPSLGKGASAAHESLALSGLGGSALSARALQAVSGVRGASGVGPGGVQSATASGDATGSPSSGLGSVAGNRPGFASVLARIVSSRVGRGQSETREYPRRLQLPAPKGRMRRGLAAVRSDVTSRVR